MRAKVWSTLLASLSFVTAASAASAQALGDTTILKQSLSAYIAAFPGGEAVAITALCIAAGTLLLRLTRWFGLLMTVATFGFVGVVLLLAYEPGALTRIVEAVRLS